VRVITSAVLAIAVVCVSLWPITGNTAAPTYSPLMSGGEYMGKPIGGNGGGPFQARCPAGENYLAGLEVTTNERISTIKLLCAARQGNNLVNTTRIGPDIGRAANDRHSQVCPNSGAVNGVQVQSDGYDIIGVWSIALRCSDAHGMLPIGEPNYATLAGSAQLSTKMLSSPTRIDGVDECPAGYIAKGVWGHAGLFIDSIGLICDWVQADPQPLAPVVSNAGKPIKITGLGAGEPSSPRPTSLFDGDWTVTADGNPFDLQLMLVRSATMGGAITGQAATEKGGLRGVLIDATHAQFIVAQDGHGRSGTLNVTLSSDANAFTGAGTLSGVAVMWHGTRKSAPH
jgi:hypothetical protein